MIDFSFEKFGTLGLTPLMARHLAMQSGTDPAAPAGETPELMRVTEVHRESQSVHNGTQECNARTRAHLLRTLLQRGDAIAVGDWVLVGTDEFGQAWVEHLFEPLSRIVRRDADGQRHTVVSNIDTALLVMGLDLDFNLRRLERYLLLVQGSGNPSGVLSVIVLTKADVVTPLEAVAQRIQELRERIGNAVAIVAVNARAAEAATCLAPYLAAGQTLVVLGSSGAGKSTLTNTLLGNHLQDTGPVREQDSRGKHTTTSRSLHCLPGGACVIDTPGVRTLRPDVDAQTLSGLFSDVTLLAAQCRFRNCEHHDEPGCAVVQALHPDRLRNYHKLLREASRDSMTVLQRQKQLGEWKARGRAGRQRQELKKAGW